jgi:hypothetical protein
MTELLTLKHYRAGSVVRVTAYVQGAASPRVLAVRS